MRADYEGVRRLVYGKGEWQGATFVPVCQECGRFVKADKLIAFAGQGLVAQPNATCSKHGRIEMLFEGFV